MSSAVREESVSGGCGEGIWAILTSSVGLLGDLVDAIGAFRHGGGWCLPAKSVVGDMGGVVLEGMAKRGVVERNAGSRE